MCDYCGCREVGVIGELSDDHELLMDLVARIRREIGRDRAGTASALSELQSRLRLHLEREEEGIFVQLAAEPGFDAYLADLEGDHRSAREGLLSLEARSELSEAEVVGGLEELEAHITREEQDLFPACRMVLSAEAFAEARLAHDRIAARESGNEMAASS
ncbi:MAG TPA: hemerythrin domain-containing protein [Acidimicrobiales bacterium]|nr:hemerythrin domain-containing protein [Acidimicrobiales bacterium]